MNRQIVDDIIDWAGSQTALANLLGVSRGAVSQWRAAGGIPAVRAVQLERMTSGKFRAARIAKIDEAKEKPLG